MAQGACHHGSTRDASQRVYPTGFIHYRRAVIRTAVREGLLGAERLAPSGPTFGCWETGNSNTMPPRHNRPVYPTVVIPLLCGLGPRVD